MTLATRLLGLIALIFGSLAGLATAAPEDYAGKPIKAIEFEPKDQPYTREYLDQLVALKPGQPLGLGQVRQAIERLYATGRYEDVEVDARLEDGGVVLVFRTTNQYFVGRVTVDRVPQPPNPGVLANATRLELGTLFTEQNAKQAVRNIQDVLRQNGFFMTNVVPRFERDPATQQVRIHFEVTTGKRARYRRPGIIGAEPEHLDDIIDATRWEGWFGWKEVTESRTSDGVDRVRRWYNKRDRLEARVSLERMEYDDDTRRVTPTLAVEPGPKVNISVTGADISRGKVRQLLPLFEEQSVDRDLLVEGARNLREHLEGQGYFDAKVDFTAKNIDGGGQQAPEEQVIEYQVVRGERHKLVAVTISGNRYFNDATLRERMYIRPASLLQFRNGRFSEAFLDRDIEAIEALYRSNGFRDVDVVSGIESAAAGKPNQIAVHLTVKEGPQWLVRKLTVEGAGDENRDSVLGMIQSQEGQPFSEFNISIDRDNILEYYYNRGFSEATFEYSYNPAGVPNQVELKYTIREGTQRFVRDVLFVGGLEATDPGLVRERVLLEPGDVLSRSRALETQRQLYDLGIFARVDMALQNPNGEERNKYVLLDFEEARKWTVTGGVGAEIAKIGGCAECLDAPAGSTGFSPRVSLGVTRRNFRGTGHILSFQSRVSTLQRRGVLSYNAPQFRGNSDVNLLFSALYEDTRDVRTFTARRREASAQIGQRLSRASTMLYRLTYRRVGVTDLKISDVSLLPQFLQPVQLGIVAGNYIQDRRDDPTDSHRGIYNTIDIGYGIMPPTTIRPQPRAEGEPEAPGVRLGTTGFLRFLGHNATYHPFGLGARYVLARAITFGLMQKPSGREIPLPERFYGGGPASHRGFPSNQAGPRDLETGFPLGGRAVLLNQLEFRYPLIGENIRGTLFFDSGNVYRSIKDVSLRVKQRGLDDFKYMVHAAGLGIRYRTPVGPVRLDFAYSINPPRFFGCKGTIEELQQGCLVRTDQRIGHFQFHFSLGQAF